MGQYYNAFLIKKHSEHNAVDYRKLTTSWLKKNTMVIRPAALKLMEHSFWGNYAVNVVEQELKKGPMVLVWGGDYADELLRDGKENLYHLMRDIPEYEPELEIKSHSRYFINEDKREYFDIEKAEYGKEDWNKNDKVHPLPLLCADGNGRGGGDYYLSSHNSFMVGQWAWCLISVSDVEPDNEKYKEIIPNFVDR